MPADSLAWFKTFVTWFRAPIKTMLVLAFLAGAAIFVPASRQKQMGILDFTRSHLAWEWAILLFCASIVLLTVLERIWKPINAFIQTLLLKRRVRNHLYNLPDDQVQVLLKYVTTRRSSLVFPPSDGSVCDLANKGILYRSADIGTFPQGFSYTITPYAAKYLAMQEFQKILSRRN